MQQLQPPGHLRAVLPVVLRRRHPRLLRGRRRRQPRPPPAGPEEAEPAPHQPGLQGHVQLVAREGAEAHRRHPDRGPIRESTYGC